MSCGIHDALGTWNLTSTFVFTALTTTKVKKLQFMSVKETIKFKAMLMHLVHGITSALLCSLH